ncbi:hypothetical protein OA92_11400 [Marinomonas sp. SBI22]|uniref:hypothetical protein n=1 Tax=unclassified Marinomonas TaxID=196814 RepID=UPI0007AF1ACC|nr:MULTISPECIES: hypothetical protein [unclassified Marinomonas]KZM42515.1 hypothetical protein OA92_11400 [Marinomonas sp. SBI22]KZM43909.1 hypothetical protein OA91_10825 [Marinomonas sp. SBI8L]
MICDHNSFLFDGYLTNRQSLIQELELAEDTSLQTLLKAAFQAWKLDFNQKVLGDYRLILPIEGSSDKSNLPECFITCSAFSSYRLFYKSNEAEFALSSSMNDFITGAELDADAIGQLFTQSYLVPPLTLVKGVRQLANGESQIWQIASGQTGIKAKCLAHKTLSLQEKLCLNQLGSQAAKSESQMAKAESQAAKSECGQLENKQASVKEDEAIGLLKEGKFNAFMALPLVSRLLSEPVTQLGQLCLLDNLMADSSDAYQSKTGLYRLQGQAESTQRQVAALGTGLGIASQLAELNQAWDKNALLDIKSLKSLYGPLFKSGLSQAFKQQRQTQLKLRQEYQTQMLSFHQGQVTTPSFELWLDLTVRLPNQWQQERLLAEGLGKEVQFVALTHGFAARVIEQSVLALIPNDNQWLKTASKVYFDPQDDSLVNLYDAMQRLMLHGYKPVTHSLLKVAAPPLTAKLIKQQDKRSQVDAFCMKSLTLDHLSRHLGCSL